MRETAAGAGPRGRLEEAARGLLYVSETESPFEYVELSGAPGLTPEGVRAALGEPADTPVAELPLDRFLAGHVEEADPADPAARESVERFRALRRTLEESLSGVKVFRLGEVRVRYYALGHTPDGRVAGVATNALET